MNGSIKNRYQKRAHISEQKFKEIVYCFATDLTAQDTAKLVGISRNSINKIFNKIRQRLLSITSLEGQFEGDVELDESYFGARRVRGKRGRGASGKTPVFGLLKRDGAVHVEIVKNCSRASLLPIIKGKVLEGSTIYTDGWGAYDSLIVNGYNHYRILHSENEFARGKNHVNGIKSFWSYAKRRLAKFNGVYNEKFYLHLKECQFRFSHRKADFYRLLLSLFKKNPL
jgi:transposase-like protein